MKTVGIIAEYNPFHKGHAYQIKKIKEKNPDAKIVVIMSGHGVQRGDFAIMDKWSRGEMAVKNGADLVVELPYCFAGQTAEVFAHGGVALADNLHCDLLAFGVEFDDPVIFEKTADLLATEPPAFQKSLRHHLDEGLGFAKARSLAVCEVLKKDLSHIMESPNAILAIEYLKAIRQISSSIQPMPILRKGGGHHDPDLQAFYPSARAIREAILSQSSDDLTSSLPYSPEMLDVNRILEAKSQFSSQILAHLLTADPEKLRRLPNIAEGLEFSLLNAVKYKYELDELIDEVSSKRMTKSRIRRILMNDLLDFTQKDFETLSQSSPGYLRVLAFNPAGKAILRRISDEDVLPVITNLHSNQTKLDPQGRRSMIFDCRSTDLFYLLRGEREKIHADYTRHPIFVEEI